MKNVLMYGLNAEQKGKVEAHYKDRFEIRNLSCFTDVIAIPAKIVILNPDILSDSEISAMNEVFQHSWQTTRVMFTRKLSHDMEMSIAYPYLVNLEASFPELDVILELEDEYPIYKEKFDNLIGEIKEAMAPDGVEVTASNSVTVRNNYMLLSLFYTAFLRISEVPVNKRVDYRNTIVEALTSLIDSEV